MHCRLLVEVVFTTLSPLTLGLGLSLVKFSLIEPTLEQSQPGVVALARMELGTDDSWNLLTSRPGVLGGPRPVRHPDKQDLRWRVYMSVRHADLSAFSWEVLVSEAPRLVELLIVSFSCVL